MHSEPSETMKRKQAAERSIPSYVDRLIGSIPNITVKEVEVLYREYRAYHRSKAPFRWQFPLIGGHANGTSMLDLLARLHDPRKLSRLEAYNLLACLRAMVAGTLEVPRTPRQLATSS